MVNPQYVRRFLDSSAYWKAISEQTAGIALPNVNAKKLATVEVPLAPVNEQCRIVEEVDKQLTRLDAAVAALKRVQANLRRYRASVLKAAVEGRLVPTEAELARAEGRDYESGDELLERILKERRAIWGARRKVGKAQESLRSRHAEGYREPAPPDWTRLPKPPEGWTWVRWGQIGFSQNGRAFPSREYAASGIKLLRPGNLHADGRILWTAANTRLLPVHWADEFPEFIVQADQLIMNLTAQSLRDEFLGRVCITGPGERCLLNQRLARLVPVLVSPRYLLWMLKSEVFRRFVNELNTGSLIQHMFTSQLEDFALPLPPLPEQLRIVAEVERRLSTIEAIEQTARLNPGRAVTLRQAILGRAFGGKLVPQDPSDEPACVLLERIRKDAASERGRRSRRGRRGRMGVAKVRGAAR